MKRCVLIVLCLAALLILCACGAAAEPVREQPAATAVTETPEKTETVLAETEAPATTEAPAETETPAETEPPVLTEAPVQTETPAATPVPTKAPSAPPATPAPTQAPAVTEAPAADPFALAYACIGKSVSSLYAAVGYPASTDYAPSCLGPGEDGNLYYNGFTVYTYRENGTETVSYVE